jgi:hypothetical protein
MPAMPMAQVIHHPIERARVTPDIDGGISKSHHGE